MLRLLLSLWWIGVLAGQQSGPSAALDEAAAAFERGRAEEAGQKLDSILKDHPADLGALILKGAVLDSVERYSRAESYYQRALKLAPGSAQVLNNVANHYLASGNRLRAREYYLKTIATDVRHVNANLQLAQMSVEDKQGARALVYLNRLGDALKADPGAQMLRARALGLSGQCSESGALLEKLEGQAGAGLTLYFSAGMAFAECKLYAQAERSFSRALDMDPTNFDVLYNLGLAALDAGDADRATSVLETAIQTRPEDVDCLYTLARAYMKRERPLDAAGLLAKAQKLAPQRADVLLLLAQVSAHLEFFKDSAEAYDEYLKLKPADEIARRERGFTLACGNQFKSALPDLEGYARKHPRDAVGFYELAIAQTFEEPAAALQSLDRALTLDPALDRARYARALLNIQGDKPAQAIEDLRLFVERQPKDTRALANLGEAYLKLDRAGDAADVLKLAMDMAPNSPMVLVHYRRALLKLGRAQEAAAVLTRLKQSGNSNEGPRPQSGLIEYLSLPPAAQRVRYLENLRRNAASNPANFEGRIRLGRELLAEGKAGEGLDVFRELKPALSDPAVLARCGRILLDFELYDPSRQFLEAALAADSSLNAARLDLAIVLFHLRNPEAAASELDKTPATDRKGDYYLLQAQILDSQGKMQEAADALNRGIQAAPTRPSLYLQAAGFLLKHKLYQQALGLLDRASGLLPDDRDLLLAQAVTLAVMPRDEDAEKILAKIQARWPEWDRPYLLNGIILEIQLRSAEALPAIETAIALGANTPEAYYYEALAITHTAPDDLQGAQGAIAHALELTSKDPYIFLLAGKISLARKEFSAAIERLVQATRLAPTLIPAHYALHDAYRAVGDEQKSTAELEAIQRLADQNAASDKSPFPVEDFVFTVRPPG